jgi:hypothetical protein
MALDSLLFRVSSSRDVGTGMLHNINVPAGSLHTALPVLVTALSIGAEVSVPDPDDNDCSLDVRRTDDGLSVKRGRHGAHGSWRSASHAEAVEWLLQGATRSEGARSGLWLWVPHP